MKPATVAVATRRETSENACGTIAIEKPSAIIGHIIAGTVAVVWGMIPPESWTDDERARGFFGLWAMLLFPVIGGIGGALTATDHT